MNKDDELRKLDFIRGLLASPRVYKEGLFGDHLPAIEVNLFLNNYEQVCLSIVGWEDVINTRLKVDDFWKTLSSTCTEGKENRWRLLCDRSKTVLLSEVPKGEFFCLLNSPLSCIENFSLKLGGIKALSLGEEKAIMPPKNLKVQIIDELSFTDCSIVYNKRKDFVILDHLEFFMRKNNIFSLDFINGNLKYIIEDGIPVLHFYDLSQERQFHRCINQPFNI